MTRIRTPLVVAGIAAAVLWTVIRSGTGILPGYEALLEAAHLWPIRVPRTYEAFSADSPLNLIAFKVLGLSRPEQFLWLHLSAIFAAIVALAAWSGIAADTGKARAIRLSILAPVSTVMLAWIGSYDPFTMLCWALGLFAWLTKRAPLMVLAGIPLGFQHFEHAAAGLAVLILAWSASRNLLPPSLRGSPLWIAPGIILGKVLLIIVFIGTDQPMSGRTAWIGPFLRDWTAVGANVAPILLWSLFAGTWAIVVFLWLQVNNRQRALLATGFALGLLALALSGDRPRVFVLILAPAVLLAILVFSRYSSGHSGVLVETVVWLAPPVLLWGKTVANENVIDLIVTAWGLLSA